MPSHILTWLAVLQENLKHAYCSQQWQQRVTSVVGKCRAGRTARLSTQGGPLLLFAVNSCSLRWAACSQHAWQCFRGWPLHLQPHSVLVSTLARCTVFVGALLPAAFAAPHTSQRLGSAGQLYIGCWRDRFLVSWHCNGCMLFPAALLHRMSVLPVC